MKLSPRRALLPLALVAALACSSGDESPRTLSRIDITPASPWFVEGSTAQFYATAIYSNGAGADVTEQASWTSSSATALSVSDAAGTRGAAEALAPGSSTVTASWEGKSGSTSATIVAIGEGTTFVGTVTYDFVPATYTPGATYGGTLDFDAAYERPVRNAVVRVMQGTRVLAETTTDAMGDYSITFAGATGNVSLLALAKTLSPAFQVEDNTDGNAIWSVGKTVAPSSATHDLHATHGWTGTSYNALARSAAPFAILDSMYTAAQAFVAAGRSPLFPALKVNWSPDNIANTDDRYDPEQGLIITSHYAPWEGEIYILGKAGDDTDEFDNHVIVHEWGHYFEDKLSRSDSPGGSHGTGDVLDPRLAFGEGYGSALAAMLLEDPIYADTYWWGSQIVSFGFNSETAPFPTDDRDASGTGLNPGPFSEFSVIRVLYDLWDSSTNEPWDEVSLGLAPIYDVLVGPQRTTPALTTIASFIAGLKEQPEVDDAKVDALLAHYSIGAITDAWGTGDTGLRDMFRNVAVPSTTAVTLYGPFDPNMQQQNRYLVFTAPAGASRVTVTSQVANNTSAYDVDLFAYAQGVELDSDESLDGNEQIQFPVTPGLIYVVLVNGWGTVNGPYTATVSISTP